MSKAKKKMLVPKLRFPEFLGKGEWETLRTSDILVKVSNPVKVETNKSYQQIGIRSHGKGVFFKDAVTGKALGNKRVFWVEENAFIVNIVFAWELAIANTTSEHKGTIASHRFPMYKPKSNKSDVRYMKYFFLTHKGKELLWIASPGGSYSQIWCSGKSSNIPVVFTVDYLLTVFKLYTSYHFCQKLETS